MTQDPRRMESQKHRVQEEQDSRKTKNPEEENLRRRFYENNILEGQTPREPGLTTKSQKKKILNNKGS